MFLIYINDITEHVNSPLRLFADDCLLHRIITTKEDVVQLQHDLDQLHEWANKWQLRFNVTKMRFTRLLSPIIFNYKLNNHSLGTSNQHALRLLSWCNIGWAGMHDGTMLATHLCMVAVLQLQFYPSFIDVFV